MYSYINQNASYSFRINDLNVIVFPLTDLYVIFLPQFKRQLHVNKNRDFFQKLFSHLWIDKTFIIINVILFKHEISTFLILHLPSRTAYMQNTKPANTGKLLQGYNIQCYLFITSLKICTSSVNIMIIGYQYSCIYNKINNVTKDKERFIC